MIVSTWLGYFSRASLRSPRSHGFYRFFAWECIVALFLLNLSEWFRDPFSPLHLVSWILLIVSAYLVIDAVYRLRRFGQQDNQRQDASLLGFEKTTSLVTTGIYRYIRHPLYSSLLFLAWGIFFKDATWLTAGLAVAATVFLFVTARLDEVESQNFFGLSYQEYMKRTKRFIPFIFIIR
jgi:protein-S-isoprenylcysteine O-methyltransferase Ste14